MEKWPDKVNTDFWALETSVNENTQSVEFESGIKRTYLKNSVAKKTYTFSLALNNKTEELAFWNWYDNTILSGSLSFSLYDFLTQSEITEYRLTSKPSVSGQYPKTLNLTVEEV